MSSNKLECDNSHYTHMDYGVMLWDYSYIDAIIQRITIL